MPENWKTYKLEDLAERVCVGFVGTCHKFYREKGKGVPMVRTTNLSDRGLDLSDVLYIDYEFHKRQKKSQLRKGDILIARHGTNGQACIYDLEGEANCLNVVIVKPDHDRTDYQWLYYSINSPLFRNQVDAHSTGSVQKVVNTTALANFSIQTPPLQEQKQIASILSALDDKIELNLQMNKTLEEMAMALYKHWFVDFGPFQDGEFVATELGEIPKGWEVKTLEDIIKFSNGYAFKSKQLLKEEVPDSFHIFKMGHILKGGGLKADGTKSWIKKRDCKGLDKYILKTGDILMSMTDMKDNMTILGHTALMNEDNKFIVNQRVGLLRVANKFGVDYPFVFLLTNSTDFIQRLRSQANSGVQVNLSTNAIKSAKVVVPNKEVNEQFNNITLPYYKNINQNALENQTLTQLRDTLLPKLISGVVRVKDVEKTLTEAL